MMKSMEPRLVVRKTFFDVEMPSSDEEGALMRSARRPKTMALRRTVEVM